MRVQCMGKGSGRELTFGKSGSDERKGCESGVRGKMRERLSLYRSSRCPRSQTTTSKNPFEYNTKSPFGYNTKSPFGYVVTLSNKPLPLQHRDSTAFPLPCEEDSFAQPEDEIKKWVDVCVCVSNGMNVQRRQPGDRNKKRQE